MVRIAMRGAGGTQRALAAVVLFIPLTSDRGWQVLTYRNIPPHVAQFREEGLRINVKRSASPIIYPLPTSVRVRRLRVRGRIEGVLSVDAGVQGQRGFDDYALRLGLVEEGSRRLGVLERRFAPEWVRRLFSLARSGSGISQVRFFNLGVASEQIGQARSHPLSALLHEQVVAVPSADGRFDFSVSFEAPIPTVAVWISADGDDTKSVYVITLQAIELESTEAAE